MTQALNSEFRPQIGLAYVSQLSMARHLFLKIIVILVRGHSITTWTNEGGRGSKNQHTHHHKILGLFILPLMSARVTRWNVVLMSTADMKQFALSVYESRWQKNKPLLIYSSSRSRDSPIKQK